MYSITRNRITAAAASVVLLLCGGTASAAVLTYNIDGVESWDAFGDADNTILVIDLGAALGTTAAVAVTGIGWDITIDTVGFSWLSEAVISFQDLSGSAFVDLTPGIDDTFAGSAAYDSGGVIDLVSLGLDFELADGVLRLEFYEAFDDMDGAIDALFNGNLQINASAVPLPPAAFLLLSGLSALGLGAGRRRRQQ